MQKERGPYPPLQKLAVISLKYPQLVQQDGNVYVTGYQSPLFEFKECPQEIRAAEFLLAMGEDVEMHTGKWAKRVATEKPQHILFDEWTQYAVHPDTLSPSKESLRSSMGVIKNSLIQGGVYVVRLHEERRCINPEKTMHPDEILSATDVRSVLFGVFGNPVNHATFIYQVDEYEERVDWVGVYQKK